MAEQMDGSVGLRVQLPTTHILKNKCLHWRFIFSFFFLAECNALSDPFHPNDLPLLLLLLLTHTNTDAYTFSYTPTKMLTRTNKQTQSYSLTCFSSTGGQLQQAPCQVNILKPCALTAEGKAQCWKHTLKYKE